MAILTLRTHNQITVPAKLTRQLGLSVGDPLDVLIVGDTIVIKRMAPVAQEDWLTDETLAEIDAAAKGPFTTFTSLDEAERALNG